MKKKPTVYLTNKALLEELNRTKATYCYFLDDSYSVWDGITCDLSKVDAAFLEEARAAKAKASKTIIDGTEGLIVRVMTDEHVPDDFKPKRRTDPRPSFPTFKHYRVTGGDLIEVGRSHWRGGLANGWFEPNGGRVTDQLALMWMTLAARYARKANWAGYSFRDDMEADGVMQLMHSGLSFNEAKSANPFAYWTTLLTNVFRRGIKAEAKHATIRDDLLIASGELPSMKRQMADADAALGIEPLAPVKGKAGRPRKVVI